MRCIIIFFERPLPCERFCGEPVSEKPILCPNCRQPVSGQERYCAHCGADLAIVAALEARDFHLPETLKRKALPLTPEVLVPRLGEQLVRDGVIDETQLQAALTYQQQKAAAGESCLLGQALLALGFVDQETLDSAITEQILLLQAALQQSNRTLEQRVTERTAELQMALRRLTQLNQIKSNFISNISHELRTPLTHIKGYLELLAAEMLGELNPEQKKAAGTALRSTDRLEKLIDDLLQFSLAVRGELSLDVQRFDIVRLARQVCLQTGALARLKTLQLECILPETPCWVQADVEKIEWVLDELVKNALKFTPEGGWVALRIVRGAGIVEISVEDTGIGIPKERIAEIFEPFHQLDETATRRYGGTGLGLALASRILDAHGSAFKVESQVDEGTRVSFSLPSVP